MDRISLFQHFIRLHLDFNYLVYKKIATKLPDFQLLWFVPDVHPDCCSKRTETTNPWLTDECLEVTKLQQHTSHQSHRSRCSREEKKVLSNS